MGASTCQYWRHIALPILTPTLLGTMILLFGNAFGAQATALPADRRARHRDPLLTRQISGDVLHNANLGYAVAMGMVVVMGLIDPRRTLCSSGAASGGSDEGDAASPGGSICHRSARSDFRVIPLLATFFCPRSASRSGRPQRHRRSSSTARS